MGVFSAQRLVGADRVHRAHRAAQPVVTGHKVPISTRNNPVLCGCNASLVEQNFPCA